MYAPVLSIAGAVLIVQAGILVYLTRDPQLMVSGIPGGFLVMADADIRRYLARTGNRT